MQRCKTLCAKRCKITNKLREVRRTLSHMYGRLFGTTESKNVVLNPVPSHGLELIAECYALLLLASHRSSVACFYLPRSQPFLL